MGAKIKVNDYDKNKIISNFNSNSKTGKYLLSLPAGKKYSIIFSADEYQSCNEMVRVMEGCGYKEIIRDIIMRRVWTKPKKETKFKKQEDIPKY